MSLSPLPRKLLRVVYVVLLAATYLGALLLLNSKKRLTESVGSDLFAAAIFITIFLIYDHYKEKVDKEDQEAFETELITRVKDEGQANRKAQQQTEKELIKSIGSEVKDLGGLENKLLNALADESKVIKDLGDQLTEKISYENKVNKYFDVFLCPPITSFIEFDGNGIITAESYRKYQNIRNFSLSLKADLERRGKTVYYGGEKFDISEGYTKSDFGEYTNSVQDERVKALLATKQFVALFPFDAPRSNAIFEAGVAVGRRVKSCYYVPRKVPLPCIITDEPNDRFTIHHRDDLESQMCAFNALLPTDRQKIIESFSKSIEFSAKIER